MAVSVSVYKGPILYGTGSCTNGSDSLTSYSGTAPISGRNVQITATTAVSTAAGHSFATKIVTDGGATLTLRDVCPFT